MNYNNIKEVLFNHLPKELEMRIRITNPADTGVFFTQLNNKWLESGGNRNIVTGIRRITKIKTSY